MLENLLLEIYREKGVSVTQFVARKTTHWDRAKEMGFVFPDQAIAKLYQVGASLDKEGTRSLKTMTRGKLEAKLVIESLIALDGSEELATKKNMPALPHVRTSLVENSEPGAGTTQQWLSNSSTTV